MLVDFFWLSFSNVENTLRILLKHSKFCSFIKTISLKQKQHVFADFSILTKIAVSGPYRRGSFCWLIFLVEFLKCWKYPSNSSETFKILFFHQNNQFEAKTACFADFSILTKIAVSGPYRRGSFVGWFFWLSFSNVENTLRILLKHSKFCSFIKTISLKQKQHVLRTFQFWPKSLYPDLTGVAILFSWFFFVEFFQMLKIPFEFFWNIQHFVLSSKQWVWGKNSMFCGRFNFDQNRCMRTLPAWPFFSWFFWLSFSNVKNTFRILLKHSKFCSFIKTISLKQKQHVLRTFQFWPKSLYPDLTGLAILLVDIFGWFFWLSFSNVENTLRILLKHSKFCSFIKTISLKQKQHVLRTFQPWTKSLYPVPTGVAIFLVDFLKCWKYPSNSSETFKILFFHQNNQFEAKTACFADFSILTKIAVSGPYRRGNFVGWFFWLSFSNVENNLRILLKHSKFCSFIKTISLKQKQHLLRTFQFWPRSLYPDIIFVAWFFWLSFSNVENTLRMLLKHSKFCSFIKTISLKQKQHVLRSFQFWPRSPYPDITGVAILLAWFFLLSWFFWLNFCKFWPRSLYLDLNTLRILLKHSKFCSFIKTISLRQQQHVSRTFQFWPKSLYLDLTGVAILLVDFFGWVFQMLKIPFEFFWNIQNFVLSSKQSVWSKNSMFCGIFNFDQNHCIRTLPAWQFCWLIFLVEFFKCWKYPSNSSETFKILFFHQNNQFEAKTACFADFSILTKIAVSGPYRRGNFVGWFFWLSFSNVENTLRILLKHSKFCSFIKTINFKQKQHVLRTFQFWPKSLYPDLTGVAILLVDFLVEFFKCENTLRILLKHSKFCSFIKTISLKQKQHVLRTFQFWPKSLYLDLTGVAILLVDFFVWVFQMWLSFSNVENTLRILLKHSKFCSFIKTISLKQKQHVLRTFQFWPKSLYPDLTGVAILLVDFFGWVFQMLKIPFEFFWNIQNFVLSSKQSVWSKNSMFCGLFNFDQNRCIRTLPAWPFFGWFFEMLKIPFEFFWNIQNLVLSSKQSVWSKNSMFCATFQFWQKSLYPDLTGVAILLVDFFCWFFWLIFQMLKIPFEFFWNIQNFVLSSKQSVWSKNSMFCGLFNFDQNRCIWTLPAWPFFWLIFLVEFSNVENTLRILLKHSKFCSFIKTISLKQKQHVLRTFQFWPKSPYPDLTGVAIFLVDFFGWVFWNVEYTLRILLKHSKFCSFIKTISLKQKQHVLRTFQFWPKLLNPDLTGEAILLVDFFGWVFQMLKIPFEFFWNIQNFVLSSKQSVWSKNSMFLQTFQFWPKSPYPDYRRGSFVGWFFCLSFSNVENTLRILLKHSKFCSFIKTISLKQKQHVLRTFQFWPKSLYPDLTGVAVLLVDFFGWVFQKLKIPFEFFWNIQNFVLSSKQSVWGKNSMFCGLFNFDQNRCIRTLPAWPFC